MASFSLSFPARRRRTRADEGAKNVCGLGVSKDYLKYKKYNPQQLAEATRKKKEESGRAEGLTRVAAPAAGKKEDGKEE